MPWKFPVQKVFPTPEGPCLEEKIHLRDTSSSTPAEKSGRKEMKSMYHLRWHETHQKPRLSAFAFTAQLRVRREKRN